MEPISGKSIRERPATDDLGGGSRVPPVPIDGDGTLPDAHRAFEGGADLGRLAGVEGELGQAPPQQRVVAKLCERDPLRVALARHVGQLDTGCRHAIADEAAGLAAGPMGGFDRAGVDGEFFPDGRWRSILIINVGVGAPEGYSERRPRLAFSDVARIV